MRIIGQTKADHRVCQSARLFERGDDEVDRLDIFQPKSAIVVASHKIFIRSVVIIPDVVNRYVTLFDTCMRQRCQLRRPIALVDGV